MFLRNKMPHYERPRVGEIRGLTPAIVVDQKAVGGNSRSTVGTAVDVAPLLRLLFSRCGLIISNYSDTMQQAIFVMWFFVVILLLLSGLFTPTRSMPALAYLTTYVNPMHYFIEAIRTVFVRGGTLQHVWHQIVALFAIGIFMASWAVQSYKKNS